MSDAKAAFMQLTHDGPGQALACLAAMCAVVAGYPLLEAIRTCHLQTSRPPGDEAGSAPCYGRAPINTIGHSAQRWTDRDRDIVTPANDLLYSNAWFDLRDGPVFLNTPPHQDRFFVLELMDVFTNNFHNIGTRNTPEEGGRFALTAPGDLSPLPQGTVRIECPTTLVWMLGRVLVDSEEDLPAARAFQARITLDGHPGREAPPSVSGWRQTGDEAIDFFENLLRATRDFEPPAAERGALVLLASVHVRLDRSGKLADLRPGVLEGLRQGHAAAMALIEAYTRSPSKSQWRYSTRLGRYGNDLMLRAATAFKGLGALSADEAIYATTDFDDEGRALDGAHLYRLSFEDGGDLPADAFWSITMYGGDRYLAANEIGRFAIGNRSLLARDANGHLNLHFSHKPPPGPQQNWLPAPAGPFYLILRLYHPQQRLLDGHYRIAPLERIA